jgi:outer membrane cobalamin receptor
VTPESFLTALTFGSDSLDYFNEPPIRPEQVQSIEVGWRGILFEKLWFDMSYYYSSYKHFIGYKFAVDILAFEPQTGFPLFFDILRISANAQSRVTTQGFSIGGDYHVGQFVTLSGNYSWNVLNKKGTDDPIVPAFNTPEHKFNIGISGHGMPIPIFGSLNHGFGFNINYKWIEGFIFEGSPQFTGFVPTYDLLDMQVNWRITKLNTTVKVGASNVLNNKQFQTYGGPRIGRLAYISFLYQGKVN